MLRRTFIVLVPLLILALVAQPAAAGKLWCKADPVVSLNGRVVSISPAIPLEYLLRVNGPTQITIKTPRGVDGTLILNDLGFMGHGTIVTFVQGGGVIKNNEFPVEIEVSVPVDTTGLPPNHAVPLSVTVTPDNQWPTTVTGTTRSTVVRLTVTGR